MKTNVSHFRMNRFEPLPDQISGLFRAMFALVADKEATVITPLLATGDQVCNRFPCIRFVTDFFASGLLQISLHQVCYRFLCIRN